MEYVKRYYNIFKPYYNIAFEKLKELSTNNKHFARVLIGSIPFLIFGGVLLFADTFPETFAFLLIVGAFYFIGYALTDID